MKKKLYHLILFFVFCFLFLAVPVSAAVRPNDPGLADQWHLEAIRAPQAWENFTGSSETIVAVLDVGAQVSHPDLQENIWTNAKEIPYNNLDDDKNGYIDDVYGWDFINNAPTPWPDLLNDSYAAGSLHHGTLIAGLIGAVGDNGTAGAGINWRVKIMSLKVLDSAGEGNALLIAKAIDYAIAQKAKVINLSFISGVREGAPTEELYRAIQRAYEAGAVIIAAAGNEAGSGGLVGGDLDFNPRYPVCYDGPQGEPWWVIGVAAVDKNDKKAGFSGYGFRCVDISAPGTEIASAMVFHPFRADLNKMFGNGWAGTSLAAPLVSGAAALLLSAYPHLNQKQIYDILTRTADEIDSENPLYSRQLGAGRLNLERALAKAMELYGLPGPIEIDAVRLGAEKFRGVSGPVKIDLDRDGRKETIAAAGRGMVAIYNYRGLPERSFLAYNGYKGKFSLAAGDLNGDGFIEIITVKPEKDPRATIWSSEGVKKGEIRLKGDYRKGVRIVIR